MSGDEEQNKAISQEFNEEMNNLKQLNEQLTKIKDEINLNNQEINSLKEYIPTWSKEFDKAPLEIKRQILDKLIEKIYLYNDKVEIKVKYPISTMLVKENV